jgi:hypothetical protein
MSVTISSSPFASQSPATNASKSSAATSADTSVEDAFLKEANKTPAQRLHEEILKELGITEQQFAAMDPKTKAAVEQKVQDKIKQLLQAKGDKGVGNFTDVKV